MENLEKSVENLEKSVENLKKSVENLEKKCEKQFQNRPGSLYRPLKQLGENSEYNIQSSEELNGKLKI